jgi:hypothetical protein
MDERKFKLSMLEYSKIILSKKSFDKTLFIKEYRKAFRYLDHNEPTALEQWVRGRMDLSPQHLETVALQ